MTYFKHKAWWILAALLAITYCLIEAQGEGDFYIFMSAAGQLLQHNSIFTIRYVDSYNYFYSVLFALCLAPFYTLPFFWVKFCWLLLNGLLYLRLFQLLAGSAPVKALPGKQRPIFLFLVFLFSFRFLHDNLHASQATILIFWCCIYGLYLIHTGRQISGAAVLALGINIKLLPIVILPYLLYRGYFKAFALTVLFYGFSLFAPSLIIGHNYNMSLLKSWLHLINPTQERHVLDVDERSFHGLSTLLATLFVKELPTDMYALPIRRHVADLSLSALSAILMCTRAALVLFTLWFLRLKPFRKAGTLIETLIEISYLLLLVPLIFPHQQHYAFLFVVPAFAVVVYYVMRRRQDVSAKQNYAVVIVLLAIIYLAANLKLLLGAFNEYYEHFKILTYGGLLLIPLLVWVTLRVRKNPLLVPEN